MHRKNNFNISYYEGKTTSGQRFFTNLYNELSNLISKDNPKLIFFNISAPLKDIILAKFKRKKVVIRVDGIYFDKLSKNFINEFNFILRFFLNFSLKYNFLKSFFSFFANFLSQNYTGFIRMILADKIIYQSEFSQTLYKDFFSHKPYDIILNGAYFKNIKNKPNNEFINVIAIHDSYRPSKRIDEIVKFINWNNIKNDKKIYLNLIGFDNKFPDIVSENIIDLVKNNNYIKTYPRFKEFNSNIEDIINTSDLAISFSYRDACPNTVIELMSYGIPFVYYKSGGLPEMIKNAGIGLTYTGSENYYTSHRFENDFPLINYSDVLKAIIKIKDNREHYENEVSNRFKNDLEMKVIAQKYINALEI